MIDRGIARQARARETRGIRTRLTRDVQALCERVSVGVQRGRDAQNDAIGRLAVPPLVHGERNPRQFL